jgi:phosphoribosylformylglycinamidine (FGAM) synthase-like amidotransferase family enzyme
MVEEGNIRVRCKYYNEFNRVPEECNSNLFNLFDCRMLVFCGGSSYVDWVYYIKNKQHLIEVE